MPLGSRFLESAFQLRLDGIDRSVVLQCHLVHRFPGTQLGRQARLCIGQQEQVLVNGRCVTTFVPKIYFDVAYSPTGSTYIMLLCTPTRPNCSEIGSAYVSKEDREDDSEGEIPAAVAAAQKIAAEFDAMLSRLWKAKTYPTKSQMVAIFSNTVSKALAAKNPSVALTEASNGFNAAGFPAAAGDSVSSASASGACNETYTGPNDSTQTDAYCRNAYFNSCIDKANNTNALLPQTQQICNVLDGTLKFGNGPSLVNYCSYCIPSNMY